MELEEKLRRVSFIVCDVDGVLTDGGIAFDGDGRPFRIVNARDVTGLTLWRLAGGKAGLVSGLGSRALEAIAEQWRCDECHMWVKDKRRMCEEIAERHGIGMERMAFVGDDIIDVRAMEAAGVAAAPCDASGEARAAADFVTKAPGGRGPVREVVERILKAQGRFQETLDTYVSRKDGPQ